MMSSFAEAAKVLNRKDYLDIATKNENFIIENLENNGGSSWFRNIFLVLLIIFAGVAGFVVYNLSHS